MGRDGGLRHRVIALQGVAGAAGSRLARPTVSAAFVAGVLERTAAVTKRPARVSRIAPPEAGQADTAKARRSLDRGIRGAASPSCGRRIRCKWNLAGAGGRGVLLLAVGRRLWRGRGNGLAPGGAPAGEPQVRQPRRGPGHGAPRRTASPTRARSTPWATSTAGTRAGTSLQQVSSGVWSVTLPLEPGHYEYMFVVDGQRWVGNPAAIEQADDGFGSRNAVLEVLPAGGAPL